MRGEGGERRAVAVNGVHEWVTREIEVEVGDADLIMVGERVGIRQRNLEHTAQHSTCVTAISTAQSWATIACPID